MIVMIFSFKREQRAENREERGKAESREQRAERKEQD
jgi:hypothetical protein